MKEKVGRPGALPKLGSLSRVSALTGARNKAPVKPDLRESGPSFVKAPGVRPDSARHCDPGASRKSKAFTGHSKLRLRFGVALMTGQALQIVVV